MAKVKDSPRYNWGKVDWSKFGEVVRREMESGEGLELDSERAVDASVMSLTRAFKTARDECVPLYSPPPNSKRWWSPDVAKLRKTLNSCLRILQNCRRTLPPMDRILLAAQNRYREARRKWTKGIHKAKRDHWVHYLGTINNDNVFKASKYATNRTPTAKFVPPLQHADGSITSTPQEQADAFAEMFNISNSAADLHDIEDTVYPSPLPPSDFPRFKDEEIRSALFNMHPNKAAGPDSIPVSALQQCWDVISQPFCDILWACYDPAYFPSPWRTALTWVIRKPNKSDYSLPNSYRPIALLNTLGKVLEAVIAKRLSYLAEHYHMFPDSHFGGRPQMPRLPSAKQSIMNGPRQHISSPLSGQQGCIPLRGN